MLKLLPMYSEARDSASMSSDPTEPHLSTALTVARSHELASQAHETTATTAHLGLHVHLQGHLRGRGHGALLAPGRIALRTLLIEQLTRLRHRHADELVLPAALLLPTPRAASELLERLHRRGGAHALRARAAAPAALVAVDLLVRLDHALLVEVLVGELLLVAGELAQHGAEEVGVAAVAGVVLGVAQRAVEVV